MLRMWLCVCMSRDRMCMRSMRTSRCSSGRPGHQQLDGVRPLLAFNVQRLSHLYNKCIFPTMQRVSDHVRAQRLRPHSLSFEVFKNSTAALTCPERRLRHRLRPCSKGFRRIFGHSAPAHTFTKTLESCVEADGPQFEKQNRYCCC